ncbi:MAG: hypothetical protein ABWU84_11045 [Pyrobaculum sp.]|uniref:hypothetical protein n=1 Tax=Pyrobaculum sp. TaxID=2004705 RepID=UPI003EE893CE
MSALDKRLFSEAPRYFSAAAEEVAKLTMLVARVEPKRYQAMDLFAAFYLPAEVVRAYLTPVGTPWAELFRQLIAQEEYAAVNRATAGSHDLSVLAAVKILQTLAAEEAKNAGRTNIDVKDLARRALKNAGRAVGEYARVNAEVKRALLALGGGGAGYALEAVSLTTYLQRPDDVRKRAELLSNAAAFLREVAQMLPAYRGRQAVEGIQGVVAGITTIRDSREAARALPSQLAYLGLGPAGRAYFVALLSTRQLLTYQTYDAARYHVFVDKSGSMGDKLGGVEKIAAAAGLALALYKTYRGHVYFFDTEVSGPLEEREVVKKLLTVEASGGTNIAPVLRKIVEIGRKEDVYIIISDGITDPPSEDVARFVKTGLAGRVRIVLVPPAQEKWWLRELVKAGTMYKYATALVELKKTAL